MGQLSDGWLVFCSALSRSLLAEPQPQGSCAALGINDGCELKTEFQGPRDYGFPFPASLSFLLSLFLASCLFLRAFFSPTPSSVFNSPFQFLPLFSFSTFISKVCCCRCSSLSGSDVFF